MSEAMTTTSHKAAAMTAASALAMYDAAFNAADKARAAAAMADVLRAMVDKKRSAPAKAAGLRQSMNAAVKRLAAIVERRNAIPILSYALVTVEDECMTVEATDLDMSWAETFEAPGIQNMRVAVKLDVLKKALAAGKGEVSLEARGEALAVIDLGGAIVVPGLNAVDFPSRWTPEGTPHRLVIGGADLKAMLAFVSPCISKEETRYYLNGAYLHSTHEFGQTRMNVVATDGSRLAWDFITVDEPPCAYKGVIIPRKAVEFLAKHLDGGSVELEIWPTHIRISDAAGEMITKVIDGSFPDYRRVVPDMRDPKVASVEISDPAAWEAGLKRIKAASEAKTTNMIVHLDGNGGLVAESYPKDGSVSLKLDASVSGGALELGFNLAYLLDFIGGEPSKWAAGTANDPIRVGWPAHPNRTGVLMPLRVR